MMVISGKGLGENVSNVVARRNLFEGDQIGLNELAEVMVANVNMLDLAMVLRGLRKSYGSSTVTSYYPWGSVYDFNFI